MEELDEHLARALIEEACKKNGLIWLSAGEGERPRAAWHVWHDGAAYVVGGGAEQPLPELPGMVRVSVRSKDNGGRLVTWLARAVPVAPGTEEWQAAVAQLAGKRLNAPDTEGLPERWATESRVIRLEPTGQLVEHPGATPEDSEAVPPPPSPATTRGRLPFVLGRRRR
ncbi:Uncharacterized protein LI90_918 [Carbonactinospora thermoautotrophica]|uniref:Pyridoxamine 5'-phosphate oxidase putative domain-containing protein n=1 Tax=Carbonactinospora thermoautotrophica TaxID=1469144 RepID=A0A132MN50_9ACTN|nr:Uncharacterized protein LI90_918 [Carbonactinospora thermoautotrophica]